MTATSESWLAGVDTVQPRDLAEARDAVIGDSHRVQALFVRGGATKLGLGWPPERVDRVIDTTGLDRLIEHDPGDMTATVQSGMTLAALAAELARAGQKLAVDPPLGAGKTATVGGVFATNDSGPGRLRYGSLRVLVIGVTVILGDGTVARSGGKVIKNVAGYDLCKLYCGALGTLGLVAELTVRLHPIPGHAETVRVAASPAEATRLGLAVMASPLEPTAVDYDGDVVWIRFEGSRARAAAGCERTCALVASSGLSGERLTGEAEKVQWAELGEGIAGQAGETVLRMATMPGQLDTAIQGAHAAARAARDDVTIRVHSHVCLGLHIVRIAGGALASHAAIARAVRDHVIALGGHAVVWRKRDGLDQAAGEHGALDPFGPPPPAFTVMRRLKEQLDPGRRFAPGRFVGRL